jgi:hypothetical protein
MKLASEEERGISGPGPAQGYRLSCASSAAHDTLKLEGQAQRW